MTRSGKFVTEHALCFSEIGRIDIEVLMTHWQGKEYHSSKILPIERGCFLKAFVGTQQRPDTEMAVEVEIEGSSTCSKEAVSLARGRGRGHPLQEQRNNGASTVASVCGPRGKLDDAVDSFNGPKVDYPFRKSTCHNSDSMFNINNFFDSSRDSEEPVVTVASGSNGLTIFLDNAQNMKELGKIDSIFD